MKFRFSILLFIFSALAAAVLFNIFSAHSVEAAKAGIGQKIEDARKSILPIGN